MGIKSLYKAVQSYQIPYIHTYHLSDEGFQGSVMAIDSEYLFTQHIYGARCETIRHSQEIYLDHNPDRHETFFHWVKNIVGFMRRLRKFKIRPIVVFEGKAPALKISTKEKRQEETAKKENRILELRNRLRTMNAFDPEYSSVCEKLNDALCLDRYNYEEKIQLINILKLMGFEWLQSTTEGEKLCSMLVIYGYANMVYSTDTDNLTYGCNFLVVAINSSNLIEMIILDEIKEILGFKKDEQEKFVEYCIMCGTDYNHNLPNIASGKALPLIMKYGNLDNMGNHVDISILNHHEVKKIFMSIHPQLICENQIGMKYKRDDETLYDYLLSINQEGLIQHTKQREYFDTSMYYNCIDDDIESF